MVFSHSENADLRQYAALEAKGYRRTSRKFGIISRIDRPDWVDFLQKKMMRELPYTEADLRSGSLQDHYRRVYSQDNLEIGKRALNIKPSSWDNIGYIEIKEGE